MPDVTPAATAKEAADKKSEFDAAMGNGKFSSQSDMSDFKPAVTQHRPEAPLSFADHIRGFLGLPSANHPPVERSNVKDAVDAALSEVDPNKPADGH